MNQVKITHARVRAVDRCGMPGLGPSEPHRVWRLVHTSALASVLTAALGAAAAHAETPIQMRDVAAGSARIDADGRHTRIEASNNAIINYNRFDVPGDHSVRFVQPDAASRVLNRIHSAEPSRIHGTLSANGIVYLVNPSGVMFGPSATVNVGQLYAAAGRIADGDFLAGENRFTLEQGALRNEGQLTGAEGVHLIGSTIANHGTILAPNGLVTLSAGGTTYLQARGETIMVEAGGLAKSNPATPNAEDERDGTAIDNRGSVTGRDVFFSVGDVYATALDNAGDVRATDGEIRVDAAHGMVRQTGGMIATRQQRTSAEQSGNPDSKIAENTSQSEEPDGGSVDIHADRVINQGRIDASGAEGGSVTVDSRTLTHGGSMRANATRAAAGRVILEITDEFLAYADAVIEAIGPTGGQLTLRAGGRAVNSGTFDARGTTGRGGDIRFLGQSVTSMLGGTLDASGATTGGVIHYGGDRHGGPTAREAVISTQSILRADGGQQGGRITIWSDAGTHFYGEATATGATNTPDTGGFIELSSAGALNFRGGDTLQTGGGTVLIDPKNIRVVDEAPAGFGIVKLAFTGALELSNDDEFGTSIALNSAGSALAVGAPFTDSERVNTGRVYLFALDPDDLNQAPLLRQRIEDGTGPDDAGRLNLGAQDRFGASVDFDGSGRMLAVGAIHDDTTGSGNDNFGAVYFLEIDPFDLSAPARNLGRLDNSHPDLNLNVADRFGRSVAFNGAGNLLAVGSIDDDGGQHAIDPNINFGAAYLFTLDPSDPAGTADLAVKLAANQIMTGLNPEDQFGSGVALNDAGDVFAVGTPQDDTSGLNQGAVYLFDVDPADPAGLSGFARRITQADGLPGRNQDRIGFSVALNSAGDLLAAGATNAEPDGFTGTDNFGMVHLMTLDPANLAAGFVQNGAIEHQTAGLALQPGGRFGSAVALNGVGDRLAAGAFRDSTGGANSGAAHLFGIDPVDPTAAPTLGPGLDAVAAGFALSDGDRFGSALALNDPGNLLAVGAPGDSATGLPESGAVYLLRLDTTNEQPRLVRKIQQGDGVNVRQRDRFGSAVALNAAGDRLAVGATRDDTALDPADDDGSNNFGAVHLFDLDPESPEASLSHLHVINQRTTPALDPLVDIDDQLGQSVALNGAGNVLAVGTINDAADGFARGAVYLFDMDPGDPAGTLAFQRKIAHDQDVILPIDPQNNGPEFGSGVALSDPGDLLAVGAPGLDVAGRNRGAVMLFALDPANLSADGPPVSQIDSNLAALSIGNQDRFGTSVALDRTGSRLAVGAIHQEPPAFAGNSNFGAVHVMSLNPADPTDLPAPDDPVLLINQLTEGVNLGPLDNLGTAVTLSGDGTRLATGAAGSDIGGLDRGAALLFQLDAADLSQPPVVENAIAHDVGALLLSRDDGFGSAVALNAAGDRLAVGSAGDDGAGLDRGAVFLFAVDPANNDAVPQLRQKIDDQTAGLTLMDDDRFGASVALDGAGDRLAVGAPGAGADERGAAFLFDLDAGDLIVPATFGQTFGDGLPGLTLDAGGQFGGGLALNQSGDLLGVGAPGSDGDRGAAFLFTLDPTDATVAPVLEQALIDGASNLGIPAGSQFGASLALDQTGRLIAVGAPGDPGGGGERGAVHLLSFDPTPGNRDAVPVVERVLRDGSEVNLFDGDRFGDGVALNHLGDRLAVATAGDDLAGANTGAIMLFDLNPSDPAAAPSVRRRIDGNLPGLALSPGDRFTAVAMDAAGDRLVIGATGDDTGGSDVGATYLIDLASLDAAITGDPADDAMLNPELIRGLLSGNDLQLLANNDILLDAAIDTRDAPSGDLTLIAGRSILFNADVRLNGSLTATANAPSAAGVIDAHRDPGPAELNMADGVLIDTSSRPGAGVSLSVGDGTGLTHNQAGHLSVATVTTAGPIQIANQGVGPDADLNLPGSITTGNSAADITLLATDAITVGGPMTTQGTATLTAGNGDVTGGGTLTATSLAITAGGAIQGRSPLNTESRQLTLASGDGPIEIRNQSGDPVTLARATADDGMIDIQQTGGGDLTVIGPVTTGQPGNPGPTGSINLTSDAGLTIAASADVETGGAGGSGVLTLNGPVLIEGTVNTFDGDITLAAADTGVGDLILNADIIQPGTIDLRALRDIIINALLQTTDPNGDIRLTADSDQDGAGGVQLQSNGRIDAGRDVRLTGSNLNAVTDTLAVRVESDAANDRIAAGGDILLTTGPAAPPDAGIGAFGVLTTTGGRITLDAADNGDVGVGDDLLRAGGGDIVITGHNLQLGDLQATGSGGITLTAQNNLTTADLTTGSGDIDIDFGQNGGGATASIDRLSSSSAGNAITGGAGEDTFNVRGLNSALTLDGGSNDDTFNIGNATNGLDDITSTSALSIQGGGDGAGGDTLNFNDANATGSNTYTLTSSSLTFGGVTAGYSSVENINVEASSQGDTVMVDSSASGVTANFNLGDGNDIVTVNFSPGLFDGDVNIDGQGGASDQLTVNGSAGDDALTLDPNTIARTGETGSLGYDNFATLSMDAGGTAAGDSIAVADGVGGGAADGNLDTSVTLTVDGEITDSGVNGTTNITTMSLTTSSTAGTTLDTNVNTLTATDTGTGNIDIIEADGLTALDLNADTGNVTLTLSEGAISDIDANTDIVGDTLTLTLDDANDDGDDVGASGDPIAATAANLNIDTSAGTNHGSQFVETTGALSDINLDAGTGDVTLDAGGQIATTDATDLVAANADLTAAGAIGAGDALHADVDTLTTSSTAAQTIIEADGLDAANLTATGADIDLTLTEGSLLDTDADADVTGVNVTVTLGDADTSGDAFGAFDNLIDTDATTLSIDTTNGNGNQFINLIGGVTDLTLNAGGGAADLATAGTVDQSAGGAITADQLVLRGEGTFTFESPTNDVATFAANMSGAGSFTYNDAGGINVGSVNTVNGITTANGDAAVNAGGVMSIDQPIDVVGLTTLSTTTGDLTVNNPLDATGRATLRTDNGNMTVASTISAAGVDLTAAQGDLVVNAAVDGNAQSMTFTAQTIALAANVAGANTITLQPDDATDAIGIAGGAGTFALDQAEIDRLQDGFSGIIIGRADGEHAITVQQVIFTDPLTLRAPASGGTITILGTLFGSDNASLTFDGPGDTTSLAADLITAANPVTFNDAVIVNVDVSIDTTDGGARPEGAAVTFNGPVDGFEPFQQSLGVTGGGEGNVGFNEPVGETTPLAGLNLRGGRNVQFAGMVNLGGLTQTNGSGTTEFLGPVTAEAGPNDRTSAGIDLSGNEFIFNQPITTRDRGPINIRNDGLVLLTPDATVTADGAFTQRGGGNVRTGADINTPGAEVAFGGPITIIDDVTINTTVNDNPDGAPVTFNNTVDNQIITPGSGIERHNLTIIAGNEGDVSFQDPVGSIEHLARVLIDQARNVTADFFAAESIDQAGGTGSTTIREGFTRDGRADINTSGPIEVTLDPLPGGTEPAGQANAFELLNFSALLQGAVSGIGEDEPEPDADPTTAEEGEEDEEDQPADAEPVDAAAAASDAPRDMTG